VSIGTYSGQRPSTAACKAFTTLRRTNKSLQETQIKVLTQGHKNYVIYTVVYTDVEHALLGHVKKPVATKSQAQNAQDLETV
jgi:hypothetical protein